MSNFLVDNYSQISTLISENTSKPAPSEPKSPPKTPPKKRDQKFTQKTPAPPSPTSSTTSFTLSQNPSSPSNPPNPSASPPRPVAQFKLLEQYIRHDHTLNTCYQKICSSCEPVFAEFLPRLEQLLTSSFSKLALPAAPKRGSWKRGQFRVTSKRFVPVEKLAPKENNSGNREKVVIELSDGEEQAGEILGKVRGVLKELKMNGPRKEGKKKGIGKVGLKEMEEYVNSKEGNAAVTVVINREVLGEEFRVARKRKRGVTKGKGRKKQKKDEQESEKFVINVKDNKGTKLKVINEFVPTENHDIKKVIQSQEESDPEDAKNGKKKTTKRKSSKKKPAPKKPADKNQPSLTQ